MADLQIMPVGWVRRGNLGTYVRDGGARLWRMLREGSGTWKTSDGDRIDLYPAPGGPGESESESVDALILEYGARMKARAKSKGLSELSACFYAQACIDIVVADLRSRLAPTGPGADE